MAKKEAIVWNTPWMTARFPKVSKPDTKGTFADGKFKTDGDLSDEDYKEAKKFLTAAGKKLWPDADFVELPMKDFFANAEDKKANKVQARGLRLKSKYRPAVFDGKRKKLPESVSIGGGSIIRVASAVFPWSKEEKVKVKDVDGNVTTELQMSYGVSLRLGDIQVRKLVEFQAQGDGSAFEDDEEGFEYEGTADAGGEQFGDATDL